MGPNTVSPAQSSGALIAMSGGVDSSIAAYLTMQTGCPCLGATMRLYRKTLIADDVNWIAIPELTAPLRCKAKTRYRQQEEWATVTPLADGKIQVTFDEPQRAMTVGQAVVLYDGDTVVGGGTILSVLDEEQGETL